MPALWSEHIPAWLAAAGDPAVSAELKSVFAMIADQIDARDPACWGSGRCCHFKSAGHLLYVTGLEAAYTLSSLAAGRRPTPADVERAVERGDCPFLARNLCGVHAVKPSGCRVYFCDRSAQGWQQDLSERSLKLIRELHDRRAVPYVYAEWRTLLAAFAQA